MAKVYTYILALLFVIYYAAAYTVEIPPKSQECFSENLTRGEKVAVTYEVVSGGLLDINIKVLGPDAKTVLDLEREQEGFFSLYALQTGSYQICFSNIMSTVTSKTVAFNIYTGDALQRVQTAQKGHMQPLDVSVNRLVESVRKFSDSVTHMRIRSIKCTTTSENAKSNANIFATINILLLIIVSAIKIYFIRRPFENLNTTGYTALSRSSVNKTTNTTYNASTGFSSDPSMNSNAPNPFSSPSSMNNMSGMSGMSGMNAMSSMGNPQAMNDPASSSMGGLTGMSGLNQPMGLSSLSNPTSQSFEPPMKANNPSSTFPSTMPNFSSGPMGTSSITSMSSNTMQGMSSQSSMPTSLNSGMPSLNTSGLSGLSNLSAKPSMSNPMTQFPSLQGSSLGSNPTSTTGSMPSTMNPPAMNTFNSIPSLGSNFGLMSKPSGLQNLGQNLGTNQNAMPSMTRPQGGDSMNPSFKPIQPGNFGSLNSGMNASLGEKNNALSSLSNMKF